MSHADQVNVIAINFAKPEHVEELKALLIEMAEATHKEAGCLKYALQQGTTDPTILAFVETWESQEALDAHSKAPHLSAGAEHRASLTTRPNLVVFTKDVGAGDAVLGAL